MNWSIVDLFPSWNCNSRAELPTLKDHTQIYAHLCFGGGLSHLQGTVAYIGGGGGEGSGRADEEGGDRELHGCLVFLCCVTS